MDGAAFPFIDMEGCGNHFLNYSVSSFLLDILGRSSVVQP